MAPEESVTRPVMLPVAVWPTSGRINPNARKTLAMRKPKCTLFITPSVITAAAGFVEHLSEQRGPPSAMSGHQAKARSRVPLTLQKFHNVDL
jgi:hypothetical protein